MTGNRSSFLFYLAVVYLNIGVSAKSSAVHRLLENLFANYSILVRPAKDQSQPTTTNVMFTIKRLESLNIKTQTMTSMGFFSINWTDDFLTWSTKDYDGIEYITIPENKIWTPDYVIDNDIGGKKKIGDGNSLVIISSNGQVLWEPGYVATTLCEADITYFPFDEQFCTIAFISWMMSDVNLHTYSTQGVSVNGFVENGEFEMRGRGAEHILHPMTYREGEMIEGVVFSILLKRRTTFYWLSLVSPLIAFPFLSPLSFLVPGESGEKTTLAITALLSVFVFMSTVSDIMPKLSNAVSYTVLYASAQVLISLLTVICNVAILCTERLSPERPVPASLKKLIARGLPKGKPLNLLPDGNTTGVETENQAEVTWSKVARYLDKLCFIVFLSSTLVITVIFGLLVFVTQL